MDKIQKTWQLLIIIDGRRPMRNIDAIHPGVTLQEDFIEPLNLNANKLAKIIGVPQNRISEICRGRRGISADTALRLEQAFGVSAWFWLNLQQHYDLILASQRIGDLHNIKMIAA
jgi:addiction module HigA family antidote